jgi:hypothetical protein
MPLNTEHDNKKHRLNWFYHFFCWCSGARLYILEKCPSEYNKFFGIGAVVFMTGGLAAITGTYALYTVFSNLYIAIPFGIFWGFLIFFLDWYIVASLRKEKKFYKEIAGAAPRIILAVLIAVVISKPLEMKLFEKEISNQMALLNQQKRLDYKSLVDENFDEIEELKKINKQYQEQINQKSQERQKLFDMIIAEAEGRSPTNQVGKGPVYKEKKAEFEKVDEEYRQLFKRNSKLIDQNLEKIQRLKNKREQMVFDENNVEIKSGFLGRLKALNNLAESNDSVKYANIFILILFIVIESSPMIVKLISRYGPYDKLLEATEAEKNYQTQSFLAEKKQEFSRRNTLENDLYKLYLEQKLEAEKENLKEVFRIKKLMNKRKLEKWQKNSQEKAENEAEDVNDVEELLNFKGKIISD